MLEEYYSPATLPTMPASLKPAPHAVYAPALLQHAHIRPPPPATYSLPSRRRTPRVLRAPAAVYGSTLAVMGGLSCKQPSRSSKPPRAAPYPSTTSPFAAPGGALVVDLNSEGWEDKVVAFPPPGLGPRPAHRRQAMSDRTQPLPKEGGRANARTKNNREILLARLRGWLPSVSVDGRVFTLEELLSSDVPVETVDLILNGFARACYRNYGSQGDVREVLNGLWNRRAALRRTMTSAWGVISSWGEREPGKARTALPPLVFRSMVTLASVWGWGEVLTWLLTSWDTAARALEPLAVIRRGTFLPSDLHYTSNYAFLALNAPKRRWLSARKETLKVRDRAVIAWLEARMKGRSPDTPLVNLTPAVLRRCFAELCAVLHIPNNDIDGVVLGSLRGGSATNYFALTEDPVWVAWVTRHRVNAGPFERYVQELEATQFLALLPQPTREAIGFLASFAPWALEAVTRLQEDGVPEKNWPRLLLGFVFS